VLVEEIERLVAAAETRFARGPERLHWVRATLLGSESPVAAVVRATPGWLLGWAIETAVVRLRTLGA
jgi:hypothetical protein